MLNIVSAQRFGTQTSVTEKNFQRQQIIWSTLDYVTGTVGAFRPDYRVAHLDGELGEFNRYYETLTGSTGKGRVAKWLSTFPSTEQATWTCLQSGTP